MSTYILRERINGRWLDFEVPGDEHSRLVKETFYGPFSSPVSADLHGVRLKKGHEKNLKLDREECYKLLGADKITLEDSHPFSSKEPEQVPPEYLDFEYKIKPLFPFIEPTTKF